MSVRMRAEAKQMVNGKFLHRGDQFTVATEKEAAELVALRFASVVEQSVNEEAVSDPPPSPTSEPLKRPILHRKVLDSDAKPSTTTKPGHYRRRDLRSDE